MDPDSSGRLNGARTSPIWEVVGLSGEYDLDREDELRQRLLESAGRMVVADLRAVTFVDSSALNVLLKVHKELARKGRELRLLCPRPQVRRVLELAGVDGYLRTLQEGELVDVRDAHRLPTHRLQPG